MVGLLPVRAPVPTKLLSVPKGGMATPPHSGTKTGKDYFGVIYSNPLGKF